MPPPADDTPLIPAAEETVAATLRAERLERGRWCAADRWPLRRRNRVCIWIIAAGLANFLVYTLSYAVIGGDARNGERKLELDSHGKPRHHYYVRGHFIHSLSGKAQEVSRGAWIYSYVHSISVPLTSGALIISMLVLSRPHILATMRGGLINGQTFVIAFGTIVVLVTVAVTALFTSDFVRALSGG